MFKTYSLRKSKGILKTCYAWYQKKGQTLPPSQLAALEHDLENLDQAILRGDRKEAETLAKKLELFNDSHHKKSILDYAKELAIALVLAFLIAVVVRQMWFELYEIPTGSMRPTFKEQDHLTVSKTTFGINIPLKTEHFYFDPALMQRTSVVIFSGDGLPMRDTETTYFGIIPYTKRYIKRLIGKPGDSLYFYGGKIYGVDKDGNAITELLDAPWMSHLEHIPFLSFQGEVSANNREQYTFYQMHQPLARVLVQKYGPPQGEIYTGSQWIKETPKAAQTAHNTPKTYSDFFGMRNFAMTRLLTKEELNTQTQINKNDLPEVPLYLELSHTPSVATSNLTTSDGSPVRTYRTVLPLNEQHLKSILENMYTVRFVVENERAMRYGASQFTKSSPEFPGVGDGTYEFYFGKAYKIGFGGIATLLPDNHPLYNSSHDNIQRLYNLGIEVSSIFTPSAKNQTYFPNRYGYFRNGDFYLLGAPILLKDDPTLIAFNQREQALEQTSTASNPYIAFRDHLPPYKDGQLDQEFIRTFGITIPEKHYLVLGDNHAVSSDSRVFGTVPEANMQGTPSLIIWPPGDRIGFPIQKPYPILTLPRLIVWAIAGLVALCWYLWHRRMMRTPVFKKKVRQEAHSR